MFEIIIIYLIFSIGLGLFASRRVATATDFISAGRNLSFHFIIAMVFATWFGAETVLGISAIFLEEGLHGLASDPFGASACLIIFGIFFARKLYKMNLLTLGDFFRKRYNSRIELVISICIVVSYLGWVSAQITALGLIFNILSNGSISFEVGMVIGGVSVLIYTLVGGMWSIAITTFVQMIVIVFGLLIVTVEANNIAGGFTNVFSSAKDEGMLMLLPEVSIIGVVTWVGAFMTMALGSIPQQDVFQRVNSAKSANIAAWGTSLGGLVYLGFAFIPMFLAYSAVIIDPNLTSQLMERDSQLVLPSLVMNHMPVWLQIVFFGSLLSVIMSTASGTLLAPSVIFTQNIFKTVKGPINDKQLLFFTRITIFVFTLIVIFYSISNTNNIHTMVENAYRVTLAGAFIPLFAGLFWSKASNFGAFLSLIFGIGTWLFLEIIGLELVVEPQIFGLISSFLGMVIGSFLKPDIKQP